MKHYAKWVLVWTLLAFANITSAEEDKPKASAKELARMEAHIKSLYADVKKVHEFQGKSGELIWCVDVHSQPAFSHSKLREHNLQFQPTKQVDNDKRSDESDSKDKASAYAGILDGSKDTEGNARVCPKLSVPIPVITLEKMARFRTLEAFLSKYPDGKAPSDRDKERNGIASPADDDPGPNDLHQYAYVREYIDNWGTESVFNVWSPWVERDDEFSLSQLWIVRGSGSNKETIESGWQVYEDLYGDYRARLFLYFTPDNYGSGGCYNLDCAGFVQVANNIYIGGGFTNYSVYNGSQYIFKLLWVRDPANGNWWLRYGDTWVGYYPTELFDSNGLRNKSDKLTYGGEIIDRQTGGDHTSTDMGGNGYPNEGFGRAAYQRSIRYVDTSYYYRTHTGLFEQRDDPDCYDIDLRSSSGSWGTYFYFGGEGYAPGCR